MAETDRPLDRPGAGAPYGWIVLAGIVVGAVVLGIGSRVAMRVVGIAASPERLGDPTEFGVVGKVTFQGTAGLVLVGGIAGLLIVLVYLALRSWLPGDGWTGRGLAFGLLLVPPIGVFILASSKNDFDLTPQALIFALFAAMIVGEGLATAWVTEQLGGDRLPAPTPSRVGYATLGGIGALGYVWLGTVLAEVV